jgi:RNA polymerase-binding transcription factor DksA
MATKKAAPKKTVAKGAKPGKAAPKAQAKGPAAKKSSNTNVKKSATPAVKKPAPKSAAPVKMPAKSSKPVANTPNKKAPEKASPVKKTAAVEPKKAAPKPEKVAEPVKKPSVAAPSQSEVKPAIKPLEKTPKQEQKAEVPKPSKLVIPKTTATASVKYQPDFMKSVLDTPVHNGEPSVPTMRYSDAELTEFRDLINKKLDTAKKELAYLQGLITRKDESGDLDEGRYMTMEDGSMSMEREQLSQMASRQIQFIDHLEKAIMRIENKTYGICRVTGKLIDKARLRAVPHATLSIEAKQMMNK